MQVIKCFEVLGHTDTTEGRAPMKVVARFSNQEAATKYVNSAMYARYCVMGIQCKSDVAYNIKDVTLTILDSIDELKAAQNEELKQKALSKLTKDEREALGL